MDVFSIGRRCWNGVKRCGGKAASCGAAAGAAVLSMAEFASAVVVLPDTGVDIPGTVTAVATEHGTNTASVLTAAAAFLCIGLAWAMFKRYFRGAK